MKNHQANKNAIAVDEALLKQAAQTLELSSAQLALWVAQQGSISQSAQCTFYQYILRYRLHPYFQEIVFLQSGEQGKANYEVFITTNGWIKIINDHPQFAGVRFEESPHQANEIAPWIECTIYRKDRTIPTSVREYFVEAKTEHASWQAAPRRLLRHRALAQCARLAFGISMSPSIQEPCTPTPNPKNLLGAGHTPAKCNATRTQMLKNLIAPTHSSLPIKPEIPAKSVA
jgi:hypothetical protein